MPLVLERVNKVKEIRLKSSISAIRKLASTPTLFAEVRQKKGNNVIVPGVSSERRTYIPMGYIDESTIATNKLHLIPNATQYEFGILESYMHMLWTKTVSGRLKSDIQYSSSIVYNNFPFPDTNKEQRKEIEQIADSILNVREKYKNSSMSDLYDPLYMPSELLKVHEKLDKVMEKAYRSKKFENDTDRLSYLFELYEKMTKK